MSSASDEKESSEVKDGSRAVEARHLAARGAGVEGRVRRATFADLEAILDINDDIYGGNDYMSSYFYIFMHSKSYVVYVYELDGQLVSLCNYYFVPGTEDLVTIMSLRVRSTFLGQGFGRPEKNPITDQFQRDYPHVTRYIIQTRFKPNIQAKIQQFKILYQWIIMHHRFTDRHQLAILPNQHQNSNPRTNPITLSYTEATDWLNSSDRLVNFLSDYAEEYIVAGAKWIPVRVNSAELRNVFANNNVIVSVSGTKESPGDTKIVPSVGTTSLDDVDVAGLSLSGVLQCKNGLSVVIHYYGSSDVDLMNHVYFHVSHYVSVAQDDVRIACTVHFPLRIDSSAVRDRLMADLGGSFSPDSEFSVEPAVHYVAPLDP